MKAQWMQVLEDFHARNLSENEVADWQNSALKNVLNHVYTRSPFYQRRLAGFDLENTTLDTLKALPFTTKFDLGDAMYELISGDIRDALYFFSTTGTTGRPSPCPRSELDFDLDNASITLSLGKVLKEWMPAGEKPVIAMICPNETHSVCLSISAAAKTLGVLKFDAFPLSPVIGFKRLFELLQQLKVNVVICSPGLLMALAEMSLAYGIDVKEDLYVKCALCCGELCTPSMAALIEKTWGARAMNWWYGSQEAGTSLVATPAGDFVPVMPNHIFEVIDIDSNLPIEGDGRGEMCLTTLVPGIKPLIRYRTGDLIEMTRNAAGHKTVRILGRVKDMVTIGGIRRSAADIETAILGNHGMIFGYQIEMSKRDGKDFAIVRVKAQDHAELEILRTCIGNSFRDAFDVACEVQIMPLLDMVTATGGWVSWKTARIKDSRGNEVFEIEETSAAELALVAERSI